MANFLKKFFSNFTLALKGINLIKLESAAKIINLTRKKRGRLFILGVGGSAGNSSPEPSTIGHSRQWSLEQDTSGNMHSYIKEVDLDGIQG